MFKGGNNPTKIPGNYSYYVKNLGKYPWMEESRTPIFGWACFVNGCQLIKLLDSFISSLLWINGIDNLDFLHTDEHILMEESKIVLLDGCSQEWLSQSDCRVLWSAIYPVLNN